MTSAPRSTSGVVIWAGPRAEHSMILIPCSGDSVAIAPPVADGRIVVAPGPPGHVRPGTYWGGGDRRGDRPARRGVDAAGGHRPPERGPRPHQSRPDGGRSPDAVETGRCGPGVDGRLRPPKA